MATRLYVNNLSVRALAAVCMVGEADVIVYNKLIDGLRQVSREMIDGFASLSEEEKAVRKDVLRKLDDAFYVALQSNEALETINAFAMNGFGRVSSPLCEDYCGNTTNRTDILRILLDQRGFFAADSNALNTLLRGNAIEEVVELHWV